MAYKVFLSHSSRDQGLVTALAKTLQEFEIEVFVAEWYLAPGQRISKKVFDHIENCDCVVVLLTRNGLRSKWVQQEVGFALRAHKQLVPLVEKGVKKKELGALEGREYIEYDPQEPQASLSKASAYVGSLKANKKRDTLLAVAIIAFLLFMIFSGEGK